VRDALEEQLASGNELGASIVIVTVFLWLTETYPSLLQALRHGAFNVVSMATTTGFVTVDFSAWPVFAPMWLLFLSCVTCSTGSTGGGIKNFRALVLIKQARREMFVLVHPQAVTIMKVGGHVVANRVVVQLKGGM
jgi:trk system potassium uptake protein TrkH